MLHFVASYMKKIVNKLERVRRMNWKSSLKLTCLRCANCHEVDISRLIDNSPCHLKLKGGRQGRTRKEGISLSSKAEIYPLFQYDCLVISQAKDSVPQLLYLSRCDVQSVKFAARKALSSLGMICVTYGLYPWFFPRLKHILTWQIFRQGCNFGIKELMVTQALCLFCRRRRRRCIAKVYNVLK